MKTALRLLALLAAAGCQPATTPETAAPPTPAQQDEAAIATYLKSELGDPASYAPVSFGPANRHTRGDSANLRALLDGGVSRVGDTATVGRLYKHTYRAKNAAGGLVKEWRYFVVYKSGQVLSYKF